MSEDLEQFDGILMTVIQKGGGIAPFFDSVFGFLQRKTDFFGNQTEAKSFVQNSFGKWEKLYKDKIDRETKIKQRKEEEEKARKKPTETTSASVKEITPEEFERRQKEEEAKKNAKEQPKETSSDKKADEKDEDKLQEGHIMPNKEKGADCGKYSWGQMFIKEISITVPVPASVRGKDLKIELLANRIYVGIKGQDPIISGELLHQCKQDSLVWTLEDVRDHKVINITFEKFAENWWETVLKSDTQKVDTRKIQPETSKVSDIEDPEIKSQIEKMMFDTRQKAMGLPTSDILQKNPGIEDFMRKHPEMDFSKAKFG